MAVLAAIELRTFTGLFDMSTLDELARMLPDRPRLIVANNVFNHSNHPLDFATPSPACCPRAVPSCSNCRYWANLVFIGNLRSDLPRARDVFHRHLRRQPVSSGGHGGDRRRGGGLSRRLDTCLRAARGAPTATSPTLARMVDVLTERERQQGLFEAKTYDGFRRDVRRRRDTFLERLYRIETKGTTSSASVPPRRATPFSTTTSSAPARSTVLPMPLTRK